MLVFTNYWREPCCSHAYEIVLQGNEVTMLHGRYRFALHWPELTMKTFIKIMSSPGDVEDVMKSLFETD